ncbi:MAG: helix-turn-helix transcriptional regulator [Eubacteriales bacterium]
MTHITDKLSVNEIADVFHLHPAYCGALFRKYEKISLLAYINRIRVKQAKNLLIDHDLSIACVGENVGFDDPYYFSKVFKEMEGVCPKVYREQKEGIYFYPSI